ncbi:hypothetical protein GCM10025738_21940 [Microbacterium fluvii]
MVSTQTSPVNWSGEALVVGRVGSIFMRLLLRICACPTLGIAELAREGLAEPLSIRACRVMRDA